MSWNCAGWSCGSPGMPEPAPPKVLAWSTFGCESMLLAEGFQCQATVTNNVCVCVCAFLTCPYRTWDHAPCRQDGTWNLYAQEQLPVLGWVVKPLPEFDKGHCQQGVAMLET